MESVFKPKNRKQGITRRWITGNLLWMFLILAMAVTLVIVYTQKSYDDSVSQILNYRCQMILNSSFSSGSNSMSSFERYNALVSAVENFDEKEKFEFMLVDSQGNTIISSSGFNQDFTTNGNYPELGEIKPGFYYTKIRLSNGEHIAVGTMTVGKKAENVTAIRLMTSINALDVVITNFSQGAVFLAIAMFCLSLFTGLYFVKSIVNPIRDIEASAKRISRGNYEVRLNSYFDDEIGELSKSINEMASGLNKTERMKNDFISSVSHELRTPLTSIKGWSETLLVSDPSNTDLFSKGLSAISNECERLSNMVEELLDFSKVESGRAEFKFSNTDIIAELTDAVISIEQRAASEGITINYNEPECAAPVYADSYRIKQIFVNLLDNAIKYSGNAKEIDVTVDLDYPKVSVNIIDHGVGIPADQIPLITQKFYKGNTSVKGSGIGLALVKDIVEKHNGTLNFSSRFGFGTTVTVTLNMIEI